MNDYSSGMNVSADVEPAAAATIEPESAMDEVQIGNIEINTVHLNLGLSGLRVN